MNESLEALQEKVTERGFGTVKHIVHTATLMFDGWEFDSTGWIVEMDDGRIAAFTTNHGSLCQWTRQEAQEKLAETEASMVSIRTALELWPAE